jgi:hypothetical protein
MPQLEDHSQEASDHNEPSYAAGGEMDDDDEEIEIGDRGSGMTDFRLDSDMVEDGTDMEGETVAEVAELERQLAVAREKMGQTRKVRNNISCISLPC